ncbi:PDDEXK nuclease domain-containing protein [Propionivibrio sp.]|uniref:PDDEXK nuclease domain-containing protein n=1 Tax=Propionivibrio sp. TaxID=2212460 RepID=UPI0025E48605|nr:PDDEXK nuclease domain-containing protein [Propionivibrio sp.]
MTDSSGKPSTLSMPPEPFASLPLSHNLLLLHKLESSDDRLWYAARALNFGWSRNVLALQIESQLHVRQGNAVTNFAATLPPAQSDLAQDITKDPYLFDFLALRDDANERAVEDGLIRHVEKFLLELGAGFALVGRQVHLEVSQRDFYLDLLFYHLTLRCFVVIDLKVGEFTPEAAGKMNFYLSAVDERFKQPGDQPSIGLILCRSKDRVIAEYALRDLNKPIGVSGLRDAAGGLPSRISGGQCAERGRTGTGLVGRAAMSAHAYTEYQLVEQPAIGLVAVLGWQTVSAMEETFGAGGTLRPATAQR